MAAIPVVKLENHTDIKINKIIYLFWLGFIIYSLSYTISTSGSVSYILCQVIQIVGLSLFVSTALLLIQLKFDSEYLKVVYVLYLSWSLVVIMRGFLFNYQFIKFQLFDATFGIFIYFAPLILLFPRNLLYYKTAFNVIIILGIAYLVYDVLFLKELIYPGRNIRSQAMLEYFTLHLSLSSGFLLLTYLYHSKKRVLLALGILVFTFLLAGIRARRGLMFMSINILIFSYFIYYYSQKMKLIFFIFSFLLISAVYGLGAKIYTENRSGLFSYITERINEKTRTGVELYFYNDMKPVDWIFGRGINGKYYCPVIVEGTYTSYRGVIETGYLQIILKGGLISLVLLLFIAIPAMFKGLFYSKNILTKAAAIWILLFLTSLYPATQTIFSLNYLLVWISIGICYSSKIRDTPESTISEILRN